MSSEFYFKTWLRVLERLENLVDIDLKFQSKSIKEKILCRLVQRLSGMLGAYYALYNDAVECLQQNLQLQKTIYIAAIINAVVARILELKHQLETLDGRNVQFLGKGLKDHKITPYDTDLTELPEKAVREENIQNLIEEAFRKAQEKKDELEKLLEEERQQALAELIPDNHVLDIWDNDAAVDDQGNKFETYEHEGVLDEETLKRRKWVKLIQAHERTRQITQMRMHQKLKRDMWTKQLDGTAKPQARDELKQRGAKIIQKVLREYFRLKRDKVQQCKREEIMEASLCKPLSVEAQNKNDKRYKRRYDLLMKYESDWKTLNNELKQKYYEKKKDDIADDIRDEIRNWFRKWYDEITYFYDIPHESSGGSQLIVKDEVLEPSEWKEEYKQYLSEKAANKGKTGLQKKQEKERKKREAAALLREERMKKALKEKLEKKLMKDPKNHPGFEYPGSKKTHLILNTIEDYHLRWYDLDETGALNVKEGLIRSIDMEKICMEVKIEILQEIDKEMTQELKKLKKALKKDYENKEEKMPEPMKKHIKRLKKKKHKIIKTIPSNAAQGMEYLIMKNVMKTYPRRTFTDFLGEYNYAADDQSCYFTPAITYAGEARHSWWDKSRETLLGFRRILLIGPRRSGKSLLVHAMASANDAVLFEFDPVKVNQEEISPDYLTEICKNVVMSARLAQPAVIYLKHVHRLFYKKIPQEEMGLNYNMINKFFIKKLFKGIKKEDKVTIIGTCIDPWLCKTNKLMKKLPEVVMVPNTNYTAVVKLLNDWVLSNRQVPRELDVHGLAHVLQGCSYGSLKTSLDNFLTGERIAKITASSLTALEVYDYVQENCETNTDYDKYVKWYQEKTEWGKKETKKIEEQLQFKELEDKYLEKMRKKMLNEENTHQE